jgi:hypothetical protein
MRLQRQPTASYIGSGGSRRPEMLALQIPKHAVKLAITDFVTTGE